MERKIKVGAVNYLNTKPLIFGFEHGMMQPEIDVMMDYPANVAAALVSGAIDIGLVPVAIIPELTNYFVVGNYCIGCKGAVESVCIFSEVPIDQVEMILLDYQSRTSVKLAQVLVRDYWKVSPAFKAAGLDFMEEIRGTTAAVVIGDRALQNRNSFQYRYDLGLAWHQHTGLPFVFAAWISTKPFSGDFIKRFDEANAFGFQHLPEIVAANPLASFDLQQYYEQSISYTLDAEKKAGLQLFLEHAAKNRTLLSFT